MSESDEILAALEATCACPPGPARTLAEIACYQMMADRETSIRSALTKAIGSSHQSERQYRALVASLRAQLVAIPSEKGAELEHCPNCHEPVAACLCVESAS